MDEETRLSFIEEIRTLSSMQCAHLVLFTGISVEPKDGSVVCILFAHMLELVFLTTAARSSSASICVAADSTTGFTRRSTFSALIFAFACAKKSPVVYRTFTIGVSCIAT